MSTARWAGARPRAGRAGGRQCSCGEAEQHKHAATACVGATADAESASVVPQVWRRAEVTELLGVRCKYPKR
eukprot:scaffold129572_cov69-Phaeocystis_antarctica.AAC.1